MHHLGRRIEENERTLMGSFYNRFTLYVVVPIVYCKEQVVDFIDRNVYSIKPKGCPPSPPPIIPMSPPLYDFPPMTDL